MGNRLLDHLFGPETRAFREEARHMPDYSFFDWLHGYVYARWIYLYVSLAVGEHPAVRWTRPAWNRIAALLPSAGREKSSRALADAYHGKVVPLEPAIRLISVKQDICLTDLEQVIPYRAARDIILHHPDHIVALECPCRAARPHPCEPLDVCLVVGEPFASTVTALHPARARRITPQEATEILAAEHERGHVHHAFFKDAMLGRYYAICNCCSCCCGAIQAHRMGVPMLASSGYAARVKPERCTGCSLCVSACPFDALSIQDRAVAVDTTACMGCGVCVSKCPKDVLFLSRDPSKSEPLEVPVPVSSNLRSSSS